VEKGTGKDGVMTGMRETADIARERAISLAKENFGSIADLDPDVALVVWVTVFRACEIGVVAERSGGISGLVKDTLVGEGSLKQAIVEWTLRLQFLNKMIPILRNQKDASLRRQDSGILTDCLKWGIVDAAEKSSLRRAAARAFAKVDPMYKQQVPRELYGRST
jgi:hypothetical protein